MLDTLIHVEAGAGETRGAYTLIECLAPAGFGPPLHLHTTQDAGSTSSRGR